MDNHIIRFIYDAIDEINSQRPKGEKLKKVQETSLFGDASGLDSLGLVNLIVAVEDRINEKFELNIVLADENAMAAEHSPFQTVATLAAFIQARLKEEGAGPKK